MLSEKDFVYTFTEKNIPGRKAGSKWRKKCKSGCNKASRQRDVWYLLNMECIYQLLMGRGEGSEQRANDPLNPACRDFPGFSTGILMCQELLGHRQISTVVTLELEAGRPVIQPHISDGKALLFTPH